MTAVSYSVREVGYTTAEIAAAAGVTYRQLDYWVRLGKVAPSLNSGLGSGHRRRWGDDDVALIKAVGELRREGFALDVAFDHAAWALEHRALWLEVDAPEGCKANEVELVQRALRFTAGEETPGGTGTEHFEDSDRYRMVAIAERLDESA